MTLRLGILGAGMIATAEYGILPNLGPLGDRIELTAIADPITDRAAAVAALCGIPSVFPSLDAMLATVDVDAVVNLTPIPAHGATCRQILSARKHLVVEKPFATTMEDADAIVELAAAKDLTVVCAPPNMLRPTRIEARRLVRDGAIGKVAFARVRASHGGPASGAWPHDPAWYYQRGSGPGFDVGVYGLHDVTGILGPARRVVAFSGITEPTRIVRAGPYAGTRIDVTANDNTLMMLDFGESTYAFVDGTFNVNAVKSPVIEIFGRTGTLNLDTGEGIPSGGGAPIEIFQADGSRRWAPVDMTRYASRQAHLDNLRRAALVDHLVDCLERGHSPVLSAEHARHALEIMLKAAESARTGRAQDLTTTFRRAGPMTRPLAIQLYTVRDAFARDRAATLARVADLGFTAVEAFGLGASHAAPGDRRADARGLRAVADEYGLRIVAAHGAVPTTADGGVVYDELASLGTDRLIAPGPSLVTGFADETLATADGVQRFADGLNAAADIAARHGARVGFHNHYREWQPVEGGTPAYDLLVQHLDPRVFLEVDVYWAYVAGQAPEQVIAAHADRVHLLHVKDGPGTATGPQTPVGSGIVDNAAATAAGARVEWHVVELDECAGDPFTAAADGARWLIEHDCSTWAQ